MDINETIQPDVSATETDVVEVPEAITSTDPVTAREAKMARLAESRKNEQADERRAAWLMDNPELSEADYPSPESLPAEVSTGQETTQSSGVTGAEGVVPQSPAIPANGWQIVNGVRVKTLMVNGQQKQITEEQYDRMLQKELAGDDKLRRAAEVEQTLNRRQQILDERERQLRSVQPPQPDAGQALKDAIAAHTELLLEGDVDGANAKMVEIISMGRDSATPNIDVIATQAATRAVSEVERKTAQAAHNNSVNEGWQALKTDYSDVVADPDALAFADIQVKRLREENPTWAPAKVIIEAGKYTREKLRLSGTATTGAATGATTGNLTAERQARKASIRPLPTVSGKRNVKEQPKQADMSPTAKIARMRQGRVL